MKKANPTENPIATAAERRRGIPETYSSSPGSAITSPSLKLVFLQDWWLIKSDVDSNGMRLGIGGFSFKEDKGIRVFASAPVVKRCDAVTVVTVDGIMAMIHGHLNRSRTLENGFPPEVYDHFVIGFPYYWEDFAALPFEAEQSHVSEGIFSSSTCNTPSRGKVSAQPQCDNTNQEKSSKTKTTRPAPCATASKCKQSKFPNTVERSGPMTRSRTRLAGSMS